jgi:exopolyphosphatase/guanosine-5'-triphosphate,3'-diphosphate pyrophosphatase
VRVAAIDIGTNSTRLLVADWDGDALTRVKTDTRITRLGRGMDVTGRLDAEAIQGTLAVAEGYLAEARALGAARVMTVATSAARDAANGDELSASAAAFGLDVRILTGDEEAALAFAGATRGLETGEHLVIDAGGGSTELVVGSDGHVRVAASLDLGCVRLTERWLAHDPPDPEEITGLEMEVEAGVSDAAKALAPLPDEAIAAGGTATTLAAIHLGLRTYDADAVDGTPLDITRLTSLRDELAAVTVAEIAAMPIVQPGRADVLVAGASLLVAAVQVLRLQKLVVRDRDILDGVAMAAVRGRGRP